MSDTGTGEPEDITRGELLLLLGILKEAAAEVLTPEQRDQVNAAADRILCERMLGHSELSPPGGH